MSSSLHYGPSTGNKNPFPPIPISAYEPGQTIITLKGVRSSRCCVAELEGIWLSVITGLDYWTKLLEWTTGMNYWTDPFCHFVAYKMIPFPVKL